MKKEVFEIIKSNLKSHLEDCKKHLDHILTTEDLSNITIKEFIELKSFAKKEEVDMTEICMVDLYHVIGMGDLTVTQMNVFLRLFKEYSSYRSDIKCLATMETVDKLPKLPSRSSFKLHKLGDITLQSKLRGRVEDEVEPIVEQNNVSDYHEVKEKDVGSLVQLGNLSIQGNIISLKLEDVDTLLPVLNPVCKRETFLKACKNKIAYCDIVWEFTDELGTEIRGYCLTNAKRDSIRDKLKQKGLIK